MIMANNNDDDGSGCLVVIIIIVLLFCHCDSIGHLRNKVEDLEQKVERIERGLK
jgi:hypothetical protein